VDPEMDIHRAHHLSYAIENKIKRDFHGVNDVMVHRKPLEDKEKNRFETLSKTV
jgi:divalent metal cation (Fe/Co/Zn/Cd) transporter